MTIRDHFSKLGRALAVKELDWNKISQQWDNVFTGAATETNKPYPKFNLPKAVNLETLLDKTKADRYLYIMPGTYGDVFLSSAVIDSIKKQNPTKDIYFVVASQFASVLEDNTNVYKIFNYDNIFNNFTLLNNLFERVYAPYLETQTNSNWTQNGYGKHLVELYANKCDVPVGEFFIKINEYDNSAHEEYIAIHTTTGQEAKNYLSFQKLVDRLTLPVIQVGAITDPLLKNVIDKRGCAIHDTAGIIKKAKLFIGGDSVNAHLAGYLKTQSILLFGSTYPKLTSPYNSDNITIIEPANRFGCEKPCHVVKCFKSAVSCINNIAIDDLVTAVNTLGISTVEAKPETISGYTTTLNPNKYYPWRESIKSMLAFCDEVVVVDGGSTDGSLEELQEWKANEPKLKVFKRKWKFDEPGMDGMMKAYSRALCTKDYCWQQDCDEIVHESDYDKIRSLIATLPPNAKVVTLPVIDLYGTTTTIRTDRGLYKARLSKNLPEITHGIPRQLRQTNKEGKVFCNKDLSDGCDYINSQTLEVIDGQVGFYNQDLFNAQSNDIEKFKTLMKEVYIKFPSVWHFSWHDLERRIKVDLEFWDKQWSILNSTNIEKENRFFPGMHRALITEELIKERVEMLKDKKLNGKPMDVITVDWLNIPEIVKTWNGI